jgi:hypothetical protein
MKISKETWGPQGWLFLHSCTFGYPHQPSAKQKSAARTFFTSLGHMLPCKKCRIHYNAYVASHPVEVDSKEALSKWLVELHNAVNKKNNKKTKTYEDVHRVHMEQSRFSLKGVLMVLGLLAILFAYFKQ